MQNEEAGLGLRATGLKVAQASPPVSCLLPTVLPGVKQAGLLLPIVRPGRLIGA